MGSEYNETRNQHFISQAEQRLNASNPTAASHKSKIYVFNIVNRDDYKVTLEGSAARSIVNNLSMFDLFSFDILDRTQLRRNFEALFHKYEISVAENTKNLLSKLNSQDGDIKNEIIALFSSKLLGFIRNPYSVQKVINTFSLLAKHSPTDPSLLADYQVILNGKRPHQIHLCKQLGITDVQYAEWLRIIFMLLSPMRQNSLNFFEETIKSLFEDKNLYAGVFVWEYDNDCCLLSDRAFSQPIESTIHLSFSFNLCATAFIDYIFADPEALVQGKAAPAFIAQASASWRRRPHAQINVTFIRNNIEMLKCYNRRVIYQSHKHVYCSKSVGILT
ncbi:hypothetical protein Q8W71_21005 [Methylobacterium sp. NEAU 140]|uniref:hypothetical protein n=1 Tax=Methylobacterium sp. NEAU 140 TaxID=3064945 RepID=UPI0027349500|nr:hypothetical protein [Methylobacterium sp. NEAU 140]MDP4025113.1 hypothetical protein [Methylobacterium sp. NEAU 140]